MSENPHEQQPAQTSGHDREIRMSKLAKLRELGVNPYAYKWDRTHTCALAKSEFEAACGQAQSPAPEAPQPAAVPAPAAEVRVAGRLMSRREHGKTQFGHIQDETGRLQLY